MLNQHSSKLKPHGDLHHYIWLAQVSSTGGFETAIMIWSFHNLNRSPGIDNIRTGFPEPVYIEKLKP